MKQPIFQQIQSYVHSATQPQAFNLTHQEVFLDYRPPPPRPAWPGWPGPAGLARLARPCKPGQLARPSPHLLAPGRGLGHMR